MFALLLAAFTVAVCAAEDVYDIRPIVIGGSRANIEDAPFMAQYILEKDRSIYQCGASIISERFVLSAAHCRNTSGTPSINSREYVLVGSDVKMAGQLVNVERALVHPRYTMIEYDILILKLVGELRFTAKIQPIKMADPNLVIKEGAILEVFGFGLTENGSLANYLLKTRVPNVDNKICKAMYLENEYEDYTTIICAGVRGKDSCKGDSGGPLIYGDVLVGVVSRGVPCGSIIRLPGTYTRVSSFRQFIDDAMNTM